MLSGGVDRINPYLILLAALLLSASLGSIHAFSIFIAPLEHLLGNARAEISLLYSIALVCLTFSVFIGYLLYRRFAPVLLATSTCCIAAAGLFIAANSHSILMFGFGYSVLFGAANGIGYGYSLQLASRAFPTYQGAAIGAVTAVYLLGATFFAKYFHHLITLGGVTAALSGMASVMLGVGLITGVSLALSRIKIMLPMPKTENSHAGPPRSLVLLLWTGYGLGAAAGLMAIGHAAAIVTTSGGVTDDAVLGAMLIGVGAAMGGIVAGWLADKLSIRTLLILAPISSAVALVVVAAIASSTVAIAGLSFVGIAYGAIIGVYPAACAYYYGPDLSAKMYGQVITAWGSAGLAAPC